MAEINKLANAKIYRIVSNITGQNYYGSTTEPTLARRLAKHRGCYKSYLKGKGNYITSFKIIETNDYEIVLVEKLDNCKSKDELHARERYYIENNECVNKYIPGREFKQYYIDNKKNIVEHKKQYYNNNKNKFLEHQREYYNDHKEKIKVNASIRNQCICGISYRTADKSRHLKTKSHQNYIKHQIKSISIEDYNFIFECDSIALQPSTYPNIIISN